ncbi:GntR family transcriptional regulator [Streptomyces microflavus]|uniref:GntR family transcriptional regulator n=1 Tax=Streptomyces microflavus TaxID=1919 RepID=UPI00368AFDFE
MPASPKRTALYRLFDNNRLLLYVGISENPARRFKTHGSKPWWSEVTDKEVVWFDSYQEARAAEVEAIGIEKPAHNVSDTVAELPPLPAQRGPVRNGQIAADLRTSISSGRFKPGSRLPTEVALMTHYGVARGTARLALAALAKEGLTEARPGSGVFVLPPEATATIQIPAGSPVQAAKIIASRLSLAHLTSLTQALVGELAKQTE